MDNTLTTSVILPIEKIKNKVAIRVNPELYNDFRVKCEANHKKMSQVLRDFMRTYVNEKEVLLKFTCVDGKLRCSQEWNLGDK